MSTYVDLLMDNGELVRIECPEKHEDDLYDYLESSMKRSDWFCPSRYEGCRAEYLGIALNRISMKRVIGIL